MSGAHSLALWAYPWDFLAEAPQRAAQRIRSTGADTVFVAVLYHPLEQVQCHLDGRVFTVPETSCWFAWDEALFSGTGLRPPPVGEANALSGIVVACRDAGLKVFAWIVCCHAVTLGRLHPEACQENCLGERLHATLCPSNAAVRCYVTGVIRNLVRDYAIDGVVLESLQYHPRRPETPYEKSALEFGPVERYFQGLCVCPACREAGHAQGADTERVRAFARQWLRRFVGDGIYGRSEIGALVSSDRDLARYHEMRRRTLQALVRECAAAARPRDSGLFFLCDEFQAGLRIDDVADDVTWTVELLHAYNPVSALSVVAERLRRIRPERYLASLAGFGPLAATREVLVDRMIALARVGVMNLAVYNYGVMRLEQLDWIREAFAALRSA